MLLNLWALPGEASRLLRHASKSCACTARSSDSSLANLKHRSISQYRKARNRCFPSQQANSLERYSIIIEPLNDSRDTCTSYTGPLSLSHGWLSNPHLPRLPQPPHHAFFDAHTIIITICPHAIFTVLRWCHPQTLMRCLSLWRSLEMHSPCRCWRGFLVLTVGRGIGRTTCWCRSWLGEDAIHNRRWLMATSRRRACFVSCVRCARSELAGDDFAFFEARPCSQESDCESVGRH